jgi:cytoskeletal protein CcmA (bactofilin family)
VTPFGCEIHTDGIGARFLFKSGGYRFMAKKVKKPDSISTFLGPDASVEGTLEFKGTIRLDGRVKGKIRSNDGTVIVGEKAMINADIAVGIAIVMGEVAGTIDASDRIEVYPPGRIIGDIQAPIISIEEGGRFNGNCSMKEDGETTKNSKRSPVPPPAAFEKGAA